MTIAEEISETQELIQHAIDMIDHGWSRDNANRQSEVSWKQDWRIEKSAMEKKLKTQNKNHENHKQEAHIGRRI